MESNVIHKMVGDLIAPSFAALLAEEYIKTDYRFGAFRTRVAVQASSSPSIKEFFDQRHGGPFDRGSADSWYRRPRDPHYFAGATHTSDRVSIDDMTPDEINAYHAGYSWNDQFGGHKDYD